MGPLGGYGFEHQCYQWVQRGVQGLMSLHLPALGWQGHGSGLQWSLSAVVRAGAGSCLRALATAVLLVFRAAWYAAGMLASRTLAICFVFVSLLSAVSCSHCSFPMASACRAVVTPSPLDSLLYLRPVRPSFIRRGAPSLVSTSRRRGPNRMA